MNKKTFLLILGIVSLAYTNVLFNDFVGDDRSLFLENDFYKNPKNLSRLLDKSFITTFEDLDPASNKAPSFSGCVSYRPVVSLSFFLDSFLWRDHTAGYHLTNLLLHLLCVFLIYRFLYLILGASEVALLASLLFAVHPVHTEVVNSIGYRSDLLGSAFYLSAFIFFIKYRKKEQGRDLLCSWIFFFFALFSKESAVTLPAVIFAYDALNKRGLFLRSLIKRKWEYSAFLAVLCFYLFIYIFIFPNSNDLVSFNLHFGGLKHLIAAMMFFYQYLAALFIPFQITILPPLYLPPVIFRIHEAFLVAAILALSIALLIRSLRRQEAGVCFLILWFFITYLPVSGLLLLPNPFAFRFLYLPSIGFFAVVAVFLSKIRSPQLKVFIPLILLAACLSVTIPQNFFHRNEFVNCKEMIRNYPDSQRPYAILGIAAYNKGKYREAQSYFEAYLAKEESNPFVVVMNWQIHHFLGLCKLGRPEEALEEFEEAVRLRPDYAAPYTEMARIYAMKNDCPAALAHALKGIALNSHFIGGYIWALHCYLAMGEDKKAEELLRIAGQLFPGDQNLVYFKDKIERNAAR